MKNVRTILFVLIVLSLAIALSACSKAIMAPYALYVDDNDNLSWRANTAAESYVVKITSEDGTVEEIPTRKNKYSLSKLEVGKYKINVKAVTEAEGMRDSEWSETLEFVKESDTGCVYELINGGTEYMIKSYGTASGEIAIEDYHRGKPVTSIGDKAFKGSTRITKVTIGNFVKTIGTHAFSNCNNLTALIMSDSVTSIGASAFQSCRNLSELRLSSALESIGSYAFAYCRSLETLDLPQGLTVLEESVFVGCTGLLEITIPDNVTEIGEAAFQGCTALQKLTIGKSVTNIAVEAFASCTMISTIDFGDEPSLKTIENYAFSECNALVTLVLPDGLESIGDRAFYGSYKLKDVSIPESVTEIGYMAFGGTELYNTQLSAFYSYQKLKEDEEWEGEIPDGFIYADRWVIARCDAIAAATGEKDADGNEIPGGIKVIDANTFNKKDIIGISDQALSRMDSLERVFLPATVRYIGAYALAVNKRLYQFKTPYGSELKVIGLGAFYSDTLLNAVTFGEDGQLEVIESGAFQGCKRLNANALDSSEMIPDTVKRIGSNAFSDTGFYDSVTNGAVFVGKWAVGYKGDNIETLNFNLVDQDYNISKIADYAFANLVMLKSVQGLSNVTTMGYGAFYGCKNLETVSLNSNLREIPNYAFSRCVSLHNVALPTNLRRVGVGAFYGCETLSEIDFSDTRVEVIEARAFYKCTNLKRVYFGEYDKTTEGEEYATTLKTIGERAFYGCISLGMNVNPIETIKDEEGKVIDYRQEPNDYVLVIPDSVETISERAFYGCVALENLDLGHNVSAIGKYAFSHNSVLKSLVIPASVATLGDYAFQSCSDITALTIENGVERIGNYCFRCARITTLVIPESVEYIGKYAFRNCSWLEYVYIPETVETIGTGVFYNCKNATIFTKAQTAPDGWDNRFNPSFATVFFGVTTSENGDYIVAVSTSEEYAKYLEKDSGISAPYREGFTFVGWAYENGTIAYRGEAGERIPSDRTLYAVWQKIYDTPAEGEEQ